MADIIPQQSTGNARDNFIEIEMPNQEQALNLYEQARQRLLDVNRWKAFSGFFSAEFTLVDLHGNECKGDPYPGDYFRIKLPPLSLGDYDWVRIEKVETLNEPDTDLTVIQVRPAEDPTQMGLKTEHFYSDKATSSFIVKRTGNKVSAEVHGRNEEANTEDTEGLLSGLRNMAVAGGALIGFSDFQWNKLVRGILGLT